LSGVSLDALSDPTSAPPAPKAPRKPATR
jgi:hypothetical protein